MSEEQERWMRDVVVQAELVEAVQDELARSPEFGALAGTVGVSLGVARTRAVAVLADYAVLFVAERLRKGQ